MGYALSTTVNRPFDETLAATREALAAQGFGVLTEIDVAGTLAATFVGAWLGYLLAGKQERTRDEKLQRYLYLQIVIIF